MKESPFNKMQEMRKKEAPYFKRHFELPSQTFTKEDLKGMDEDIAEFEERVETDTQGEMLQKMIENYGYMFDHREKGIDRP